MLIFLIFTKVILFLGIIVLSLFFSIKLSEKYYGKNNYFIEFGIILITVFSVLLLFWSSFILIEGFNFREELRNLNSVYKLLIRLGIIIEVSALVGLTFFIVEYIAKKFEKEFPHGLMILLFFIWIFLYGIMSAIIEPGYLIFRLCH